MKTELKKLKERVAELERQQLTCDHEWKLEVMSKSIFETLWEEKDRILELVNTKLEKELSTNEQRDEALLEIKLINNKIENEKKKKINGWIFKWNF